MIFFRFWFPVLLYSGIIFWVSSLESVETPQGIPHFDKVCHLAEYGLFGLLLCRAIWNTVQTKNLSTLILLTTLGSLLYGMSDEFHQSFVSGRDAGLWDVIADTIGGFLGGMTYICIHNIKEKRNK